MELVKLFIMRKIIKLITLLLFFSGCEKLDYTYFYIVNNSNYNLETEVITYLNNVININIGSEEEELFYIYSDTYSKKFNEEEISILFRSITFIIDKDTLKYNHLDKDKWKSKTIDKNKTNCYLIINDDNLSNCSDQCFIRY